jgi:hypothetical protein
MAEFFASKEAKDPDFWGHWFGDVGSRSAGNR